MLKKILFSFILVLSTQSFAFAQNGGWWQGVDTEPFANGELRDAYCDIIDLMEGNFGGMLMTVAGILAFATAAFGNFKHGITALVVGISSFAIAAMTSLYFGQLCGGDGQTNRVINNLNINPNATATTVRTGFIPTDADSEQSNNLDPFGF